MRNDLPVTGLVYLINVELSDLRPSVLLLAEPLQLPHLAVLVLPEPPIIAAHIILFLQTCGLATPAMPYNRPQRHAAAVTQVCCHRFYRNGKTCCAACQASVDCRLCPLLTVRISLKWTKFGKAGRL